MTLAATPPIVAYLENGSTTAFAVPFQFQASADLVVTRQAPDGTRTLALLGADYAVTGGATPTAGWGTGTVTVTAAKPTGWTIEIKRYIARTQPTDYTPGDTFPAETHEAALDREMAVSQEIETELADISARALRVPPGETVAQLPSAANRANKMLGFLADGSVALKTMLDWLGSLVITVTAAAGFSVPTLGLLAGILGPSDGQTAYVSKRGIEGWFRFSASNHATDVTNDPGQIIWVAKSTDLTGASGAWERVFQRPLNVKWANAAQDGVTDDTVPLQRTINMAVAQRISEILVPYSDNPLLFGKVTIPAVPYNSPTGMQTIRFRGEGPPSTWFGTLPLAGFTLSNSGSILKSNAVGGAAITVLGNSHGGYNFSWLRLEFKDIYGRTYDNPNTTFVDATLAQQFEADISQIDTGIWPTNAAQPTHSGAYGIITPARGNGAFTRIKDTIVAGYYYGVQANEHTYFDYSAINCCLFGVQFMAADHASFATRLAIYRCQTGLTFDGPHWFGCDQLDIEHAGAASTSGPDNWQQPVRDMADLLNYAHGYINWFSVLGNVGIDNSFTTNGGANIVTKELGAKDILATSLRQAGGNPVTLTTGVLTPIPLEIVLSDFGHLKSGDNTTFVLDAPGTYRATFQGTFASNATGYRLLELFNATISIARDTRTPVTGINTSGTVIRPRFAGAIGDEFQVKAQQNSGGDLNLVFSADSGVLTIEKIA